MDEQRVDYVDLVAAKYGVFATLARNCPTRARSTAVDNKSSQDSDSVSTGFRVLF
jgi:hypothetical protein